MRKSFCLLWMIGAVGVALAQNCENHVVFRGSVKSRQFTSVLLNSRGGQVSDASQPELPATAWTCFSLGAPKCYTRGLFRFDLRSIPNNAIITGARLYLFAKKNNLNGYTGSPMYGDNNTCVIQRVTSSWKANSVGWINQPNVTGEGVKVMKGTNYQLKDFVLEVTDFVKLWVKNPAANHGMLLRLQNEQELNSMVFESGKAAASRQPRLEICYSLPDGSTESEPVALKPVVVPTTQTQEANAIAITALRSTRKGEEVYLQWSVSHPPDTFQFEVERSTDGVHFYRIPVAVLKDKDANGYRTIDRDAEAASKYFYRIRLNRRGRITYSQLLEVTAGNP